MSSPVVKLTKLDDSIVKLRMDPKMMKVSGQIMDKLVKYHISSLIGLHMPDFHKDFPDKIPPKLWFPGKGLKKSGEKTIKVKKEASTLEEEAKKFVKEEPSLIPQRKRSTRFSGSYSAEVIHKPASVVRQLKKKVRTTSEASTSSYASSSQTVKPITINCGRGKDAFIRGVDYGSSSSSPGDSSDSEHEAEQKQEQNPNKKVENAQVSYQNVVAPQQTGTRTSNQQEFPSYRTANPSPTVVPSSQILSDSFPAPVRAVNPFRAPRHARQLSDSSSDEEVEVQTKELNLNVQQDSVQELTPAVEQDSVETKKSPGINENVQAKTNGTVFLQDQKLQEPPTAGKSPDVQPAVSEEPEIPEKVVQSFAEKPTDNPKNGEKEKRTSQDSVTVMKVHVNKTSPKPVAEMKKPEKEKKPPANKAAEVQVGKTTQKPEAELKKPEKEKKSPINEAAKIKEKNVRKSANEKDTVKNEAKKSISNKDVKKKSYEKPKFIDPPMMNPKTLKPVKKVRKPLPKLSENPNDLSKLGGIFGIDNGWDKTPPEPVDLPTFDTRNFSKIPRLEKKLPQLVVPTIDQSSVDEAHDTYAEFNVSGPMFSEQFSPNRDETPRNLMEINATKKNYINFQKSVKISPKTSKFDRFENESESDSDEDALEHVEAKKHPPDSESDDEASEQSEAKEVKTSPKNVIENEQEESEVESTPEKRQKLDESMDEEDLLLMEDVGFDDLDSDDGDEYLPPKSYRKQPPKPKVQEDEYTSELDGLKIKLAKDKPMTSEESREEFDRNTQIIIKNIEDPIEQLRKKFFNDICENFINNKPCDEKCGLKHEFLPMEMYLTYFESRSLAEIDEFYRLCVSFPRLFEFFFPLFAEMYAMKNKNSPDIRETQMSRLIMQCERTPKMQSNGYQQIVTALEKTMPRYKALQLLIKYYEISDMADDILLKLVSGAGADLFRLLPYLESVQNRRTFPSHALDRILSVTVQFENPRLSMFCLNNLVTRSLDQIRLLDKEKVAEFLNVQAYTVDMFNNQNFASKLETVVKEKISKVSQRRN